MALQGDLQSFALPDVLRLLAGTAKSGRLEVRGPGASGQLGLRSGGIVDGAVHGSSTGTDPGEVLFELLRLDSGSFEFAEGDHPDGPTTDVEFALERAEALVREWAEVEQTVPSMDAWVALASGEGDHDGDLTLSGLQWRTVVAIGGGGNVRDLAAALELSDLDACRAVASLADADLVDIRLSHAAIAPSYDTGAQPFELDSFDHLESYDEPVGMTELEDLVVEDRPVVMEESEDALLPEPLPSEGVAYEGEEITGAVDGRTFDVAGRADDAASVYEAFEQITASEDLSHSAPTDAGPFVEAAIESPADAMPAADDERGSLLKFLSTVKP